MYVANQTRRRSIRAESCFAVAKWLVPLAAATMLVSAAYDVRPAAANAGRATASQLTTPLRASFTWSLASRFGTGVAGEPTRIVEPNTPEYARPATWTVELNACASTGASTLDYIWSGVKIATPRTPAGRSASQVLAAPPTPIEGRTGGSGGNQRRCVFTAQLPEGRTSVTLRVRDQSGNESRAFSKDVVVRDYLIVSIGESFASGEGLPDVEQKVDGAGFVTAGPQWADKRCHRSSRAGAPQAAYEIERRDPHTSVTFIHLACSGAQIKTGLLGPYSGIDPCCRDKGVLPPQLTELQRIVGDRKIDALIISVGGNDAGFVPFAVDCATPWASSCIPTDLGTFKYSSYGRNSDGDSWPGLNALPGLYGQLATALGALNVLPANVYLTEYPDLTRNEKGEWRRLPDALFAFDADEVRFAGETFLAELNRRGREAATANGWTYVGGLAEASKTHGLTAAGSNRWFNTPADAVRVQGPVPKFCSINPLFNASTLLLGALGAAWTGGCFIFEFKGQATTNGTLHPNAGGYNLYKTKLLDQLDFGGFHSARVVAYDAIPTVMAPGQQYDLDVTMKNTGTATWQPADVKLGIRTPPSRTNPWTIDARGPSVTVQPGQTSVFRVRITAPIEPERYQLQLGLLHIDTRPQDAGAVEAFGDKTSVVSVRVMPKDKPAECVDLAVRIAKARDALAELLDTIAGLDETTKAGKAMAAKLKTNADAQREEIRALQQRAGVLGCDR